MDKNKTKNPPKTKNTPKNQQPFIATWTSEITKGQPCSFQWFYGMNKAVVQMPANIGMCHMKSHKFSKMWMSNLKTMQ